MYNAIDQTLDGKKLTKTDWEFDRSMIFALDEGSDVTMWDGQQKVILLASNHVKVLELLGKAEVPKTKTYPEGRIGNQIRHGMMRIYARLALEAGLAMTNKEQMMTTDGRTDDMMTDGQTTMTTDGQLKGGQSGLAPIEEVILNPDDPMVPIEQLSTLTAGGEESMMIEVDPLALMSPSFGTPVRPASCTSTISRSLFRTPMEDTPSVSGLVHDTSEIKDDMDDDIVVKSKRVIGRTEAVVEDEEEVLSSASFASTGWDSSMASSSRAKGKGVKRGREVLKGKGRRKKEKIERNNEEGNMKRIGKKKEMGSRETTEEMEKDGACGEPKGIVDQALETMSSSVLGAAIKEWVDKIDEIRIKSKNLQGKLSGDLKKCVKKIREGTTLMMIRLEATGDPHFLRMRNSELVGHLREAHGENVRLEEQLRRVCSATPSPLRKRRAAKAVFELDAFQSVVVDPPTVTEVKVLPSLVREEFPPLPQRHPRVRNGRSVGVETSTEAYFTQQINALVAARDLEREKLRREHKGKESVGSQDVKERIGVDKGMGRDKNEKRKEGRKDGDGRVGPRITSNVQLVPSFKERLKDVASTTTAKSTSETEWRVVDRRRKKDNHPVLVPGKDPPAVMRRQQPKIRMPRPPSSLAVTITGKDEGFSYAAALKNARNSINLEALGIKSTRIRKALNGGSLIELPGETSRVKAEELVTRLRDILKDSAAISCPIKKRELRVTGFDESVSMEDISEALSKFGDCPLEDVKIGPIRTLNNGLGTIWAQLPVAAAAKVASLERIRLGWTVARVELLMTRPLQCYRCWAYGHVQNTCKNAVDRRKACFKCGQQGHMANGCQNVVHCAICHDAGLEVEHRMGGPQCMAQVQHGMSGRPTMTI